ncbi:MAG: DUF2806 domain-containing protein [Alphaproteobacteria bacterium]|jgi:ferritin-like protein|nr:DUF2806 domain-containing protein [Alphaproteobacteria bacterium]
MIKNIKLPESSGEGLGKGFQAIGTGIGNILNIPPYIAKKIIDGSCCIASPLMEKQTQKANIIKNLTLLETIQLRENENLNKFALKTIKKLSEKPKNELPEKITDTDNTIRIMNLAKETSDEDFLDFWAKLCSEEFCKPNSLSKKTLNLISNLDKKTAQTFEKILKYCDIESGILFTGHIQSGVFMNDESMASINDLDTLKEYGLIMENKLIAYSENEKLFKLDFKNFKAIFHSKTVFPYSLYLTSSGLEIQKILKIYPNKYDIKKIYENILKAKSKNFIFNDKKYRNINIINNDYVKIITNNGEIILPENSKSENINDYIKRTIKYIEENLNK